MTIKLLNTTYKIRNTDFKKSRQMGRKRADVLLNFVGESSYNRLKWDVLKGFLIFGSWSVLIGGLK